MVLLLVLSNWIFSQNREVDSLRRILLSPEVQNGHDSVKCRAMINLAWKLVYSIPDSAIRLTLRAEKLVPDNKRLLGACYHAMGWFYDVKTEYDKSLEYYDKAMVIWKENSMLQRQAASLGNMGSVYANMGDYPKALDIYLKSQLICEQLGLKEEVAIGNNNIGLLYSEKNDYKKALSYYVKALEVFKEVGNERGVQSALSNIGVAYSDMHEPDKALKYLNDALIISERIGDKLGMSTNLGGIGLTYHSSDPDKALSYYQKALAVAIETGDKDNIATWKGNIGELYLLKNEFKQSEKFLTGALSIFVESKDLEGQMQSQRQLSELYEKMGKMELSLSHYRRFSSIKDTLFNAEKEKAITFREMSFEFEKKQSIVKASHDKVLLEAESQKKKQQLIIWLAGIGIALVIVFFIFIFRSLQIARKQKDIISAQKHLVEEKQREVLDSIHYARRIQTALMPSEWYFDKNLRSLKN
jgi:tetratricopeptide (TPR) repeat protein